MLIRNVGLKQAARRWADRLVTELLAFGFTQSIIDTCLFMCEGPKGTLYLLSWVDDLIIVYSNKAVLEELITHLSKSLPLDDKGELDWVLRMKVMRDRDNKSIILDQTQYIDRLLEKHSGWGQLTRNFETPMENEHNLSTDQSPQQGSAEYHAMDGKRATYMTVVGALLWLSACTRPDLTYSVSVLARFVSNPGTEHYRAMLRVLAYLYYTRRRVLELRARPSGLKVYSDASWMAALSISGGLIFYAGCLITWWTRKQKSVSHSSAEAEYFAASMASREALYVRDLLEDLGLMERRPTPLLLDSKGAISLTEDPVAFKKTKHILRAAYELRDRVARGLFKAEYVEANNQLADIMTKGLRAPLHKAMMPQLLVESPA